MARIGYTNKEVNVKSSPSAVTEKIRVYFSKVPVVGLSGKKRVIVSDGRGGNGFTHWRGVYPANNMKKILASIADSAGITTVSFTNAEGYLRGEREFQFHSLKGAVSFLLTNL